VTELPRAVEQRGEKVALKRGSGYALESGGDLTDSQLTISLQAAQGGEHFGIEVCGNMELVTAESKLHRGRYR
jgi:hypothetical protein